MHVSGTVREASSDSQAFDASLVGPCEHPPLASLPLWRFTFASLLIRIGFSCGANMQRALQAQHSKLEPNSTTLAHVCFPSWPHPRDSQTRAINAPDALNNNSQRRRFKWPREPASCSSRIHRSRSRESMNRFSDRESERADFVDHVFLFRFHFHFHLHFHFPSHFLFVLLRVATNSQLSISARGRKH